MTRGGGVNSGATMEGEEVDGMLVLMNEFDLLEDGWWPRRCRACAVHPWWVDRAALSTAIRSAPDATGGFWHTIFVSDTRIKWKQQQSRCWY
jgi:hypothetical protein